MLPGASAAGTGVRGTDLGRTGLGRTDLGRTDLDRTGRGGDRARLWSPGRGRPARRRAVAATLLAGLAGLALATAGSAGLAPLSRAVPAAAQSPDVPSGLFGLWPHPADDPADDPADGSADGGADVVAVVPMAGSTDQVLRVAVRFAEPFNAPEDGYRVSVVVGDPSTGGDRRVSYLTAYGTSSALVENRAEDEWVDAGPGIVGGSPAGGELEFDLPLDDLGGAGADVDSDSAAALTAGATALWVEVTVPRGGGSDLSASGYFALAAFLPGALEEHPATAAGLDPVVGGSRWGSVDVAGSLGEPAPFPLQPALKAPTLAVANRALLVTTELAAPTAVDGTQVTSTIDRVHLVAGDLATPSPGYLEIDRVTGAVELRTADARAVAGDDGSWSGTAPDPTDPGGPFVVTVDLPAVAGILGLPEDVELLAVAADRTMLLADGRTIVAAGTGASTSVISEIRAPSTDGEAPSEAGGGTVEDVDRTFVTAGAVVGVVLLAVVVGVLIARRRRSGARSSARGGEDPSRPVVAPPTVTDDAAPRSVGGRSTPDEVIAALEQQVADIGLGDRALRDHGDRGGEDDDDRGPTPRS